MTDVEYDPWDQVDANSWFLHLPPNSLSQAIAGEFESATITRERDGYWVDIPTQQGQNVFPDLKQAKQSGQDAVNALWTAYPAKLAGQAGLDVEQWKYVSEDDGHGFRSLTNDNEMWLSDGEWHLYQGDIDLGVFDTPLAAAQAIISPTPR